MNKKFDAVCIGTCLLDISTSGLDFDTFLENEPNLAEGITYSCGGDAVNQSVVLSRLGHKVGFLGCVGDDFVGRFICETAAASGVDVSHMSILPGVPTAANNILIGAGDKRVYTISRNKTSRTELGGKDIDLEVVKEAKLVSVGSIFVHPKLDKALEEILGTAKEAGAIVCADVCPSGEECSVEKVGKALPYVDYLFANESEAKYLSGKDSPEEIAAYFETFGVKNVIVKLGEKGSFIKTGSESFYQKPYLVKCVDTTGAGDCFAAGFISGLLKGLPARECAQFATACSSLTIQKVGATAAIENRKQVEEFLDMVQETG